MPKNRFIRATTTRLDLSDGDWIDVRDRLTWGQQMEMQAAGIERRQTLNAGGNDMNIDIVSFNLARLKTFIVAWSFTDPESESDAPVPVDDAHLRALDAATASEIEAALNRHVAAQEAASATPFVANGVVPPSS